MKDMETFHALNRFGLGPARGEADAVGRDPRGWAKAQIAPHPVPRPLTRFKAAAEINAALQTARVDGPQQLNQATRLAYDQEFFPEVVARARVMIATPVPLAERMVLFWSNHFTTSNAKAIIGPAIPAYEREAIRPHVFGRFADMLKAVVRHPVMIGYLDNQNSLGENSPTGLRRRARTGRQTQLNENLAREILELHTLGVDGGYAQDDVIAFANAITGWSHGGIRFNHERRPLHGGFEFKPHFHEPGPKTVLGKTYAALGEAQGKAILDDLARHPATATHLATKLVRHFVADIPPPEDVARIAAVFRDTDGDLAEVTRALVDLDSAWSNPMGKTKSHYEFVIAVHRATGSPEARREDVVQPLREMGQMPFTAKSPAGWGDRAADWITPEALMRRVEWVRRYCLSLAGPIVPLKELDDLIGPVAREAVRIEVARAATAQDAVAMILASPEFQRR